jgi:hypothetical protein
MAIKRIRRVARSWGSFVLGGSKAPDACHHSSFDKLDLIGPCDSRKHSIAAEERKVQGCGILVAHDSNLVTRGYESGLLLFQ